MRIEKTVFRNLPIGALAALGLCGMLTIGCANNATDVTIAEKPDVLLKLSESSDFDTFTTKGKPTKSLITPFGAQEIYDPEKDPDVKRAFDNVYNISYSSTEDYFLDKYKRIYADKDLKFLFQSREVHHRDVMRKGCKLLFSYECGAEYGAVPNQTNLPADTCKLDTFVGKQANNCEKAHYLKLYGNPANACEVNARVSLNIMRTPIGSRTTADLSEELQLSTKMDKQKQLRDFFEFECKSWKN